MVNQAYRNYIASPRWKAKRELYWKQHGRYCKACGSTVRLQVHHMTYERFGRELMSDLLGLCKPCHQAVTTLYWKAGRKNLRYITLQYVATKRLEKRS